jgi:hypothetical protein
VRIAQGSRQELPSHGSGTTIRPDRGGMPERLVVVVARTRGVPVSAAPEVWAPLRWALSWARPNDSSVELVLLRRRGERPPDAELLAVLDTVRAEAPSVALSLRTVTTGRRVDLAAITDGADLLVLGSTDGSSKPLRRRDLLRARCPWLVVAGGGLPDLAPPATGSRQEPSEDVANASQLPSVD